MSLISKTNLGGGVGVKKISGHINAPLSWKIRNTLSKTYLWGRSTNAAAKLFSKVTGIPTATAHLSLKHLKGNGQIVDYGIVGYRVITTAFVNDMVDELIAETATWGDYKYHDSGVGVTAPNVADTDIETTDGESRATGTQVENAPAIYESVGTIAYTTTKAITEHGLFNASTVGTLMDRHTFTAVNVVNGDSIQFTFDLTVSSGG